MKSLKLFAAVLILTFAAASEAQLKVLDTEQNKLFITLNTVGTAQALNHENVYDAKGAKLADIEPGFQNAFGDLGFVGKFGKNQESRSSSTSTSAPAIIPPRPTATRATSSCGAFRRTCRA